MKSRSTPPVTNHVSNFTNAHIDIEYEWLNSLTIQYTNLYMSFHQIIPLRLLLLQEQKDPFSNVQNPRFQKKIHQPTQTSGQQKRLNNNFKKNTSQHVDTFASLQNDTWFSANALPHGPLGAMSLASSMAGRRLVLLKWAPKNSEISRVKYHDFIGVKINPVLKNPWIFGHFFRSLTNS